MSAVSFNDRLFVFSVLDDGSVSSLAFTVDGGSWVRWITGPIGLQTAEPIATAVFRNRLYLFARDRATNALRVTSSADLDSWDPWAAIPRSGSPPASAVAATALGTLSMSLERIRQVNHNRPPSFVILRMTEVRGLAGIWLRLALGPKFARLSRSMWQPQHFGSESPSHRSGNQRIPLGRISSMLR